MSDAQVTIKPIKKESPVNIKINKAAEAKAIKEIETALTRPLTIVEKAMVQLAIYHYQTQS